MGDMADWEIEQMQNPEQDDYKEEYLCSICKYNEDKYIRICYDCENNSKWQPKNNKKVKEAK
jgi:hypothetical protein